MSACSFNSPPTKVDNLRQNLLRQSFEIILAVVLSLIGTSN